MKTLNSCFGKAKVIDVSSIEINWRDDLGAMVRATWLKVTKRAAEVRLDRDEPFRMDKWCVCVCVCG